MAMEKCGEKVIANSVSQVFEKDSVCERESVSMVMSVVWKNNEGGRDQPKSERRKIMRELVRASIDFLDGVNNYLTYDHIIIEMGQSN